MKRGYEEDKLGGFVGDLVWYITTVIGLFRIAEISCYSSKEDEEGSVGRERRDLALD